ncbi:MAG: AMP-binding protein [Verrucomicrobia bacterium]|nr:AMP-binding protein [Verrucomicrobiota bacterium]
MSLIRGKDSTILQDNKGITLTDLLEMCVEKHQDKGISIYDRRGIEVETRLYPEILKRVQKAAGCLSAQGVEAGDRILVSLPTCWELLDLWLGCVYLGALPAAIAPPIGGLGPTSNFHERLERFRSVVDANHIVSNDNLVEYIQGKGIESLSAICVSATELLARECAPIKEAYAASAKDMAFLQFTSGSTGMPRAVMILHQTLVHNVFSLDSACGGPYAETSEAWNESLVSWLPLNHDMGLIGVIFALSTGKDIILMNPTTFLARPFKWLEAGSGRRFVSPAPTFGYQFCVERIKDAQLEGIDLSQPKRFCIGSEMVRPDTMAAFLKKMEPTGLKAEHFMPCYGMAESTLGLTFDQTGRGIRVAVPDQDPEAQPVEPVVCCGTPIPDTEVRVVDPANDTDILAEGKLGAIQAKGPSIFAGYYRNEEATASTFTEDWLKTGDLGFIRNGELYIVGRAKEILILRGENLMPHDIEWQVEEVRGRGGVERCGAFSIVRGSAGEEPVLVIETSLTDPDALKELDDKIRSRIGRVMSLVLADLAFIRRGQIPKTTSGKIKRSALKEDYLQGRIERLN